MKREIKIGALVVQPGEKKYGPLKIATRHDGSDIYVPLMIVNGASDGPVLNISSGCHGDEYEGGEAIRRAYHALNPKQLAGALLGVPIMNPLAFEAGYRLSPTDHLNLNRTFPGKERGFYTERLAYVYLNEIVKRSDCVADLHGGGNIMTLAPMVIYRDLGGEALAKQAYDLARSTGFEWFWKSGGGWTGPVVIEAQKAGIPAVTVEVEGEGRNRERVIRKFEQMIDTMLKFYQMVEGAPALPEKVNHFEGTFMHTTTGGLYHQTADVLAHVKQGQVVATVSNYFGEVQEEIQAPYDGVVMSQRTFGGVEPGGWTLMVGKIV
jgi:predicted deacylase